MEYGPMIPEEVGREMSDSLKKTNSLLATMVRQNAPSEVDWLMMEEYAHEGVFSDLYSFGDKFLDTWKDITDSDKAYTYPWRFNHVGEVTLADGEILKNRPFLQLHYAHKYGVQFSHQQAIMSVAYKVVNALSSNTKYNFKFGSNYINFTAPSGGVQVGYWLGYRLSYIDIYDTIGELITSVTCSVGSSASGTSLGDAPTLPAHEYYFTLQSSWGSNAVSGDAVSFTLSTPLSFGEKICGCYGMPDQNKANWKIYTYKMDGITKIEEGISVGSSTSGTYLGVLGYSKGVAGDYLTRNMQEVAYGCNRYKYSAVRQYLNSAENVGKWWKPQTVFDIAPDQLSTLPGFLSGCSEAMIDAIKPVAVKTYISTAMGYGSDDYDITYDKVFLPSLEEMYINPQHAGEGENHEYWVRRSGRETPFAQGGTYPELIHYAVENHTSAQSVRLRSAYRGNSINTWNVYSSGYVSTGTVAYLAFRFSPLVVL